LILLACAAVGVLAAMVWRREPEYGGKKLSEWLEEYRESLGANAYAASGHKREMAEKAVLRIGTNAVPLLTHWASYEVPTWRQRLVWAAEKVPDSRARGFLEQRAIGGGALRAEWGLIGFRVLGPAASGAIPELSRRVSMGSEGGKRCAMALAWIGGEGIVALVRILTNSQARDRDAVVRVIEAFGPSIGTNAVGAVPILCECLGSSNAWMGNMGAEVLGVLAIDPDRSVPALTNALVCGMDYVRPVAAWSLGRFGGEARLAVPALTVALEDRDSHVRWAVTNALRRVAPEVLGEGVRDGTHAKDGNDD
jgi:hypothetical protein